MLVFLCLNLRCCCRYRNCTLFEFEIASIRNSLTKQVLCLSYLYYTVLFLYTKRLYSSSFYLSSVYTVVYGRSSSSEYYRVSGLVSV